MGGRECNRCKNFKVWEEFAINKKGKNDRKSICKVCSNNEQKKLAKQRREEDPEGVSLKRWEKHVAKVYKLSLEEVESMLVTQGNRCAICRGNKKISAKRKDLYIDHCHRTGKVRGMLCSACNSMLGFACDNTDTLRAAIIYLEKSNMELAK